MFINNEGDKVYTSFKQLREANVSRKNRWHGETQWTLADWSNAMCGEAGEAANVVKKLRRHHTALGDISYNTPPEDELYSALAKELADVVTYADLLAAEAGIDLEQAVINKFNHVSEKNDFPEKLK